MNLKADRRRFLKNLGLGGVGMGLLPSQLSAGPSEKKGVAENKKPLQDRSQRPYNGKYTAEYLNRLAMPIGGMGAGMFCLEGTGAISHMSVRNQPDLFNEPGMFAAISVKGLEKGAKVLEGPVPDWKKFGLRDAGNGLGGAITGLPHFKKASFETRFPFGVIELEDNDLPLQVKITGWSPFIPGEDNDSSLPVGALEYTLKNTSASSVDAIFSFNSRNFLKVDKGKNSIGPIEGGFVLSEAGPEDAGHRKCDFAVFTDESSTVVDHCWFRGGWWDPLTITWNTIKNAEVKQNEPVETDAPGASLYVPFSLAANQEKTIRVMLAWYSPETELTYGKMGSRIENCEPAEGCANSPDELGLDKYDKNFDAKFFKPWYSSQFSDVQEVAAYWTEHYAGLRRKSDLFTTAFYASTLPAEVVEAVAANLSILKSPTVRRQFDGRLWNFEGCGDTWGCCHGSCTHVWNYAQAIPHLFPALERSLRHTEFCENQNAEGHQNFRATLPIQPNDHSFHAAADGQLGGIMKVYREWRISGDNEWLGKMYPLVKSSMDFCIRSWDPGQKGILEEPHHNTYDIEFWGPDGMHMSFYAGALNAISQMGAFLKKDVRLYRRLAKAAKTYMEKELFDGEYFVQKIKTQGLQASDPIQASAISMGGHYSEEARALLEKEGPKYQYGAGCLSDGVLGAWISRVCGLGDPIEPAQLKSHLLAVHKYNLKDNLSDHANPQRPTYALGDDGGLLLCSWPKGGKLSLPFVYSDEVWTGIEYQVAAHLMELGAVEEGLEIVRTCRDRYDGRVRNPFNEYECGNWYARALASYGLLQGLTGVRYDAVDKTLFIDSRIGDFTTFLATETGFGNVMLKDGKPSLNMLYGDLLVDKVVVSGKETTLSRI